MKLSPNVRLLAAGLVGLLAASCQKVVDLDLKSTDPRLTIEANLADDGHPCTVLLSQSVDYTQTNTFPAVMGATITLSDNAGNRENLRATSTAGQYQGSTVLGVPGRTYVLSVAVSGQTYVASSTLPSPVVPFLGLHTDNTGLGSNITLVPDYQDPAGTANYYLFRQYRNGHLNKTIFIQNDEFTDGKANSRGLMGGGMADSTKLVSGDSLRVEMQNIDSNVYEYFRTLNQILQSNPLLSTTPANPQSNFSNNALGYFSAHSRRQRRLVIP